MVREWSVCLGGEPLSLARTCNSTHTFIGAYLHVGLRTHGLQLQRVQSEIKYSYVLICLVKSKSDIQSWYFCAISGGGILDAVRFTLCVNPKMLTLFDTQMTVVITVCSS